MGPIHRCISVAWLDGNRKIDQLNHVFSRNQIRAALNSTPNKLPPKTETTKIHKIAKIGACVRNKAQKNDKHKIELCIYVFIYAHVRFFCCANR